MVPRHDRPSRHWILLLALCLSPGVAAAQMNTGDLSGVVQDPSGAVVPKAAIVAKNAATQQTFSAASNDSGEYLLAQLPPGDYSITASAPSFKQAQIASAQVHVGDRLRHDFTLQVGDSTEVLTVEATSGGIQLESAEVKDVVQRTQILALPLKGRQFLDLALLSEGVVRPPGGTRGDSMQQAGTLVNVLGQRSGHNLYLLDGTTVTDQYFNNMVIAPSIDGIQEFNLLKTSYSPEFGGKSGAVVNVITRSGTNRFTGTLFEFVRNDIFDAKNFFDSPSAPIPPFRQNQFGGTLGGPVIKNKTFFFLSYEGQKTRKSLTQTFSVPTDAMRQQIPAAQQDPVARALLAKIPLPNLPGVAQNLRAVGNQRIDSNAYSVRIDHQLSSKDSLYLRASIFDARQFDPFGSSVLQEALLPGFGRSLSTHTLNGVTGWTHAFSPALLNEFRFGLLKVSGGQGGQNVGNTIASQTGLQGVTTNPADLGYPQFSFGGQFSAMGDPALFTTRTDHSQELTDNVIWHRGSHTYRAGAYFMHFVFQPLNPNNARGTFAFTSQFGQDAFTNFLQGHPTTAQAGLGRGALDARTNWAHFYFQDSWQMTRNLNIDLGIRYEFNQNMTETQNRMAAIDPNVPGGRFVIASDQNGNISPDAAALLPFIPIPYVTSKAAGWNNSLLQTTGPRLAPRAGIAWSLPGNRKTVIRASFGIYPNQAAYSIITNLAQTLPFFVTKTVTSPVTATAPTFTTENALTASALGTVGGSDLNHDFMVEYNEVWNFNVERELTSGTTLTLAYIGSRTVHADSSTVLNVPMPGQGAVAARRPIPQLSQFTTIRWDGWASYNAFAATFARRLTHGLFFDVNWTWSHSIDDASDPGATLNEANLPQDVYNYNSERASSSFDRRQRFIVSFAYQIPAPVVAPHWAHVALADWQVSGSYTAQTGAPFTVNLATDQANIGSGPAQRPNMSGDPNNGPKTPDAWFNTSVFSLPALFTFGNSPRNGLIGPGLQDVDLSFQKQFSMGEALRLQFRAEAYNLLNHPNFNIPNRTAFSSNFGKISSAQDPRQLQLALKLIF